MSSRTARFPASPGTCCRGPGGECTFTMRATPAPRAARIWSAHSETRDYRESRWEPAPLKPGETMTYHTQPAKSGNAVFMGEVEYEIHGIPLHLTTTFQEPGVEK